MTQSKDFTVLVDMDGVLENLHEVWIDWLNIRYDTNVKVADLEEWDISTVFPDLSRNQIFAPLREEGLWRNVEPLGGAAEVIEGFQDSGFKVVVLTAAHPDTVVLKYQWLREHFPMIKYNDVIFANQKQLVMGDVLIDDAPHNLIGGGYNKFLFDAPYNEKWRPPHGLAYTRVFDWGDINEKVRELATLRPRECM